MHLAEEEGGSFHHGRIMSGRWEEREKQGQIVSVILSVTIMILVTISLVRKVTWNLFVGKCNTHTHTHTRTFSEKYLKCEACKLHCRGEKPDLVSEDLASSPGSADYLFSAWLNLKNSLQDWEGRTGGGGVWWLWTCVLQEVFTHPFIGTCGFGCYSVPPCYTLGFPPPGCASPQGGPSLRHQEKEAPPLHVESFLWESNLCLLLLSMSLSMSVSLCLDLPRKHEGWSIMAGQYFYSRLISVDPIHVFSLITQ